MRVYIPDGFLHRMAQIWNLLHPDDPVNLHSISTTQIYEVLDRVLIVPEGKENAS